MLRPTRTHRFIAILVATALVLLLMPDLTFKASDIIGSIGGDNIKNYYTFLYQSLYPNGSHFNGMNYPFGEHILFTDGQPLLSLPLGFIRQHVYPLSGPQAVGIMHLFIAASYAAGQYFIFRLLYAQGVRTLPALLFSALILFLSPQLIKIMTGHFALANGAYLPALIFWTYAFLKTREARYLWLTGLLSFIMTFHHLYFGAFLAIWAMLFAAGYMLFEEGKWKEKTRPAVWYMAAVLIPVAGIQLWLKRTDPVTDRPVDPFGGMEMFTHWQDVLQSSYAPLWKWLSGKGWAGALPPVSEGTAYPGIAVLLLLMAMFVHLVIRLVKRADGRSFPAEQKIGLLLLAGFLLAASAIPVMFGNGILLRLMPALKQFRSFGRFSWVFYYLAAVGSAVWINNRCRQWFTAGRRMQAVLLAVVAGLLWITDASGYVLGLHEHFRESEYFAGQLFAEGRDSWGHFLAGHRLKGKDFQGILTLPYIHIGSEKLWMEQKGDWILTLAIMPSLELQLPMMDCKMSRTSWRQTFDQMKTTGGPFAAKPVLNGLTDQRPLLLMVIDNLKPDPDEQFLIDHAAFIGHHRQTNLYVLHPHDVIRAGQALTDSLLQHISWTGTDTCIGAGDHPWKARYSTDAAFPGRDPMAVDNHRTGDFGPEFRIDWPAGHTADSILYEFSGWARTYTNTFKSATFWVECLDSAGQQLMGKDAYCKTSTDSYGQWLRAGYYFYTPPGTRSVRITYKHDEGMPVMPLGHLLLRPASATVISRNYKHFWINNHFVQ